MKLSALESAESFALLGPGFTGDGWILHLELSEESGRPEIVFAPYERDDGIRVFRARKRQAIEPVFDDAGDPIQPVFDATDHPRGVSAIREAIARGDVYQVNLTLRAGLGDVTGGTLLSALCRRATPRFAAWIRLPGGREFVSASPELFFAIEGCEIRVEPMKGTAPVDAMKRLEASAKDASELAMITDLMRNDLVPLCEPRSVHVVDERRFLELPYATQTVSDIRGRLLPDVTALDALRALHPGGSITGAPKNAAVHLISQLETTPRGAYCGALGLISGDRATFSLLIRTAEHTKTGWVYGVGGGIVWDSNADAELEEIHVKLGALR